MDLNFAIGIIDAVIRENLTETGDLVEIQKEIENNPKFAGDLGAHFKMMPEQLAFVVQQGIGDIRSHHERLTRRQEMWSRRGRW